MKRRAESILTLLGVCALLAGVLAGWLAAREEARRRADALNELEDLVERARERAERDEEGLSADLPAADGGAAAQ